MFSSIRPAATAAPAARACPLVSAARPFVQHAAPAVRRSQAVVVNARGKVQKKEVAAPVASGPVKTARYETLIVLKPTLTDEERDQELARFETFLHQVRAHPVTYAGPAQLNSTIAWSRNVSVPTRCEQQLEASCATPRPALRPVVGRCFLCAWPEPLRAVAA